MDFIITNWLYIYLFGAVVFGIYFWTLPSDCSKTVELIGNTIVGIFWPIILPVVILIKVLR